MYPKCEEHRGVNCCCVFEREKPRVVWEGGTKHDRLSVARKVRLARTQRSLGWRVVLLRPSRRAAKDLLALSDLKEEKGWHGSGARYDDQRAPVLTNSVAGISPAMRRGTTNSDSDYAASAGLSPQSTLLS